MSFDLLSEHLSGVLGEKANILSAQDFGNDFLKKPLPGNISNYGFQKDYTKVVACKAASLWMNTARSEAIKIMNNCGAVNITYLAGLVSSLEGVAVSVEKLAKTLEAKKDFQWLDKEKHWFWFTDVLEKERNRVVNYTRKILCVAEKPVYIHEIQTGISRSLYSHGVTAAPEYFLPTHILLSVCKHIPNVKNIQNNRFYLIEKKLDYLGSIERIIYDYMSKKRGIVGRYELIKDLVDTNIINSDSFHVFLSSNLIFTRISKSIYALKGWTIDESRFYEVLQNNLENTAKKSRVKIYKTNSHHFQLSFQLTQGNISNRSVLIPANYKKNIPLGEYDLISDSEIKKLRIDKTSRIGSLITAAIYLNYKEGDTLKCEIDTKNRQFFIL